jgi:hypothetical protein
MPQTKQYCVPQLLYRTWYIQTSGKWLAMLGGSQIFLKISQVQALKEFTRQETQARFQIFEKNIFAQIFKCLISHISDLLIFKGGFHK